MSLMRRIFFYLLVFLLIGFFAVGLVLRSDFFWRWAGWKAVTSAQQQIQGDLQVGDIQGNPVHGLFFKDIVLTTPETELFRARSLEIRLSFWSLLKLKPVIGKLILLKPHLALRQDDKGQWNISSVLPPDSKIKNLKERPSQLPVPIRSVRFNQVLIVDGEVDITKAGQTQQLKNLDLDVAVNIDNPFTPEKIIRVEKAIGAVSVPQGRVGLTSRLTYSQQYLDIPLLDIKTGKQTLLSLTGKADLKEGGQIQAKGELALPSEEIQPFWDQWPPNWDVRANLDVQGELSQVRLSLTGKVQEATLDLAGTLGQETGTWNYDLKGTIKNLKPDILAIYNKSLAQKVSKLSPLAAQFHLQGKDFSYPPAQLSWSLEGQPVQYGAAKVDRFKFTLTGDKQKQQFQGTIEGNIGQIAAKASGSLLTLTEGQFNVQVDALNPVPLGLGAPEGTIINAKLDGKLSAPGVEALDRLKVSGDIAAHGKIGPHPLRKLQARLAWEKTKLEIAQANVQVGNLIAELQGVMKGDKLDFSHQGKSTPGGNWPVPAGVDGQLSWEGSLKGRLTEPQVVLRAKGRNLCYENFGIRTVISNADSSGLPPSKGQINLQATGVKTPVGYFSQASLRGDGGDHQWDIDLRASGPQGVKIDLRGATDLNRHSVTVQQAFFSLNNVKARNLRPVKVRFSPGIEVEPTTFQINQGRVSLQASLTSQQVSGSLNLQDLAAEWFAPKNVTIKGKISGQFSLAGQPRSPIIQGNVSFGPGGYQDLDFQSVHTSLNYQDRRVNLSGGLKTKEKGPTLSWKGQVPLRLSLMPFTYALGQEGMRILVQGDNVDLSILPSFTQEVEAAKGALKLQAKIEGSLAKPEVFGELSWDRGFIKLRQTGASYQLLPGEVRLQDNRLSIPQLTLQSEGTVNLNSNITLVGFLPDEVRTRVQLNNFKALDKLGSEAFVDGMITLSGRWPNLSVDGNLGIPKASFRLSYLNLGTAAVNKDVILVRQQAADKAKTQKAQTTYKPEVWKNLNINVDVKAPNNVWVDDRIAKIESAMAIFVRKKPGQELMYYGKVRALEGQVFIVGREFQVAKGTVDLPDKPGAEPLLDARITYEMTDVTLYADASGPVSNPKITLGGDPAISENDWMAYLLYGKPAGALTREEHGAGVAAGAFGGLASQMILRDFLGMKRPLTKGLTVTYQRRGDPLYQDDPYQVVIKYRLNRRFSLESQMGGRNTGGDVLFNHDF